MDYLDGRIPLATFNELNCHHYKEIIQSKHNVMIKKFRYSFTAP